MPNDRNAKLKIPDDQRMPSVSCKDIYNELKLTSGEAEAIALDWLWEVLSHKAKGNDLRTLNEEGELIPNELGSSEFIGFASLRLKSKESPLHKPDNIESIYNLLSETIGTDHRTILQRAFEILRIVIAHAKQGHQIVYLDTVLELKRISDARIPYPSLQPEELRRRWSLIPNKPH